MSLSVSLNNATSGLAAASRGAEVVSSNLANGLTEGYARRSLAISPRSIGGGVCIDGVLRHTDAALIADRRLAEAAAERHDRTATTLARLESLVGPAGGDGTLADRLTALEQSLVTAAADPASETRLAAVVDRLSGLASSLDGASKGVQALRAEADAEIAAQVRTLNDSLSRVQRLNAGVVRLHSSGEDASALLDQRQQIIDGISAMVPLRLMDRGNGQLALMSTEGQMLLDGSMRAELGFSPSPTITPEMTLDSGGLSGITLDGDPLPGAAGSGRLAGGTISAAFALRDDLLPKAQQGLDGLARDLVERFSDPATDPSLPAGAAGLLTDGGAVFDPAREAGLSQRLAVSALVDPAQGGAVRHLRDGLGAAAGPAGEAAQLTRWSAALEEQRPAPDGSGPKSAAVRFAEFLSQTGAARLRAEEEQGFAAARFETLQAAELAQGVDSDAELQHLMRLEQAYAANAKVIETVGAMIRRLMEI